MSKLYYLKLVKFVYVRSRCRFFFFKQEVFEMMNDEHGLI